MAKIHGKIGSLCVLLNNIGDEKIKTLEDIDFFNNKYSEMKGEIILKNKACLLSEINSFKKNLNCLLDEYSKKEKNKIDLINKEKDEIEKKIATYSIKQNNFLKNIYFSIRKKHFRKKKKYLEKNFNQLVEGAVSKIRASIESCEKKINYLNTKADLIVEQKAKGELDKLNRVKQKIEENENLYLGAIGENQVLNELKKLPDSFQVINNLSLKFSPPIYNKKKDDRIYSIQVDHVVVGPTGLFIIETKNWSQESSENVNLFSPVKQIKRANFALFVLLNGAVEDGYLNSFNTGWGEQKISTHNIVIPIHHVPVQEFQFVKILSLKDLVHRIRDNRSAYSESMIEELVKFLLNKNL